MDRQPFSDMDWLDTAAQTLDRAMQENLYARFSQSKTDFDRVQFMHEHRANLFASTFERYFSSALPTGKKNAAKAIEFRKQGNDFFVNKNLSRAACCYRASIGLSTPRSQDMALSYGNLSAVLFELNLYHESIRAIQLASDAYPRELKFKLVFRRAACYHKLHDPERSAQELKICRDLIKQTTGLDRKKIDAFCREMDQLSEQTALLTQRKEQEQRTSYQNLDDLVQRSAAPSETLAKALFTSESAGETKIPHEFCPPSPPSPPRTLSMIDESKLLYKGAHRLIPCASSVLRVIFSKDKGRHLIATEEIPGDALILSERPYACLLLPKFAYTYCDHCLTSIVIPHVCPRCSDVLFCSEFCQEKAMKTYHRYECDYIHILKTLGIGFLAYRTLTSTERELIRSPTSETEKPLQYKSDYSAVQRLITHSEQMSLDDLFHYSLTAYFLSEMIKLSGYLPLTTKDKSSDEEQLLLASILLKHIQQMICNAQTISIPNDDLLSSSSATENEDPMNRRFASAIFPTCALMNHSCLPNIRCLFDQGCLHVQAARTIRKGEEILNCYGPQKSLMPSTDQRQTILYEQYFFKCQCEGCVESKCNGGKVKTSLSRSNVDQKCFYQITAEKLSEAKRLFTQSLSSLSQNQTSVEQGLVLLENSIRFYERLIGEINLDTVHLYEYVASIYNDQHQFEQTSVYLNKCISILKRNVSPTCSSNTILLVDVLRKYAQTLFNCRKFDDARRTIAEAQFLLDQISPISLNEEDSTSNNHVLQTMEDLKAKCDLCIG